MHEIKVFKAILKSMVSSLRDPCLDRVHTVDMWLARFCRRACLSTNLHSSESCLDLHPLPRHLVSYNLDNIAIRELVGESMETLHSSVLKVGMPILNSYHLKELTSFPTIRGESATP
jgi:hypothetical protein